MSNMLAEEVSVLKQQYPYAGTQEIRFLIHMRDCLQTRPLEFTQKYNHVKGTNYRPEQLTLSLYMMSEFRKHLVKMTGDLCKDDNVPLHDPHLANFHLHVINARPFQEMGWYDPIYTFFTERNSEYGEEIVFKLLGEALLHRPQQDSSIAKATSKYLDRLIDDAFKGYSSEPNEKIVLDTFLEAIHEQLREQQPAESSADIMGRLREQVYTREKATMISYHYITEADSSGALKHPEVVRNILQGHVDNQDIMDYQQMLARAEYTLKKDKECLAGPGVHDHDFREIVAAQVILVDLLRREKRFLAVYLKQKAQSQKHLYVQAASGQSGSAQTSISTL
jgi:hypothetical protein